MITIDDALVTVNELNSEELDLMIELLIKRRNDAIREGISKQAESSLIEYYRGEYKPMTANEAIDALEEEIILFNIGSHDYVY
jgi:hypothetical protein